MIYRVLNIFTIGLLVTALSACASAQYNKKARPSYTSEPIKIVFASSIIMWPGLLEAQTFLDGMKEKFTSCGVEAEFVSDLKINPKPQKPAYTADKAISSANSKGYQSVLIVEEVYWPIAGPFINPRYISVQYYDVTLKETVWKSEIYMQIFQTKKDSSIFLVRDLMKNLAADGILTKCSS